MAAVAFMSWGIWCADCPNAACANAMQLTRGQTEFVCSDLDGSGAGVCGTVDTITWPADPDAVEVAVAGRDPAKSWLPGGEL